MKAHGQEPVNFEDIRVGSETFCVLSIMCIMQDEIYDMVKPAQPLHITLQDLITRYIQHTTLRSV